MQISNRTSDCTTSYGYCSLQDFSAGCDFTVWNPVTSTARFSHLV